MLGKKRKGLRRSKSLSAYRKRLWAIFSEYIRRRYADSDGTVQCFTCGKKDHWTQMDAGHYHPRTNGLAVFFDERNVHPQCTGCNRFRHGNLTSYAVSLRKKYGGVILEELDALRQTIRKISAVEYCELIETYQEKLKKLTEPVAFRDYK